MGSCFESVTFNVVTPFSQYRTNVINNMCNPISILLVIVHCLLKKQSFFVRLTMLHEAIDQLLPKPFNATTIRELLIRFILNFG